MKTLVRTALDWFAGPLLWLTLVMLMLLGIVPPASAQAPPTVTFTLETSTADGRSVQPRLTWSTTPAAQLCTASGDAAWTGTKPAQGTELLPATTASQAFALVCQWPGVVIATLTWGAPTVNTDGTPYTNPGGYRVQYGREATAEGLTESVYIQNPGARSWVSPQLTPGNWYFGVRAYNVLGLESDLSSIVSKAMTANVTRNAGLELVIKIPSPPGGLTVE